MSGYSEFSMSNNAVAAYENGLLPASQIGGVPAALVKQFCRYSEWHHCSCRFNEVLFYDPAYVRATFGLETSDEHESNPAAVAALAAHKAALKAEPDRHDGCTVHWLEWSGNIRHRRSHERTEAGCRVSIKGSTATITLVSGTVFTKRLTTRGFKVVGDDGKQLV
jgi:hypothetical protein